MNIIDEKYRILKDDELTEEFVLQALALDKETYPTDFILDEKKCIDYFRKNRQIYTMICCDNQIIGYLNFSPIDKASYERIKSGSSTDVFLSKDNIESLSERDGRLYFGYLSSIIIKKEFRHQNLAHVLIDELATKMKTWAENGIWFKKIVADALTEGGAYLCKEFGMQRCSSSRHLSTIYEMTLIPTLFEKTETNARFYDYYMRKTAK